MRPPRAVTRSTAYFRNWSEAAPFHLRIARRKMRADIAVRQRAEDGVDQRMQADIAVGMREKALGVRHADAAEHQMIAIAEGMNVVAGAGPDIAEQGCRGGLPRGQNLPVSSVSCLQDRLQMSPPSIPPIPQARRHR